MTPLIISADDFAQSAAIDAGILSLIEKGRITATSCLTMSPRWSVAAKSISSDIRAIADIGLHLDFTQFGNPLKQPLFLLMLQASCRGLSEPAIRETIKQQLDAFETGLGSAPDYIDGHQHVHQLPQIRDILIEEVSTRYQEKKPWIRISKPILPQNIKARIIDFCGAETLKELCVTHHIRHTKSLAGIYDFSPSASDYWHQLTGWANTISQTAEAVALMCHPAIAETSQQSPSDPIYPYRTKEFDALSDDRFLVLLTTHQIQPVRGSKSLKPD